MNSQQETTHEVEAIPLEELRPLIRDILAGVSGPPRDIVVLNAAAALWTAGRDESPSRCAQIAAEAIDSGAARDLLAKLAELSNA